MFKLSHINDQNYYKDGYEKSVSNTHAGRNVENSLKFILPFIKQDFEVLDVGSGPGTTTIDLSRYLPNGFVTGVEPTAGLIEEANSNKAKGSVKNVEFRLGSAYELPFEDNTFDLVYCHQVLIHLQDPLSGLTEMSRVTKNGGFVCAREAASIVAYPEKYDIIPKSMRSASVIRGSHSGLGMSLRALALDAGFPSSSIHSSSSNFNFSDDESRQTYGNAFIKRVESGAEKMDENEEVDKSKRKEALQAWKDFIDDSKGWLIIVNGEVICKKE